MKKIFLVLVLLMSFACVKKEKQPENLMTKQEMINFLIDLHIIEARLNMSRIPDDTVKLFFNQVEDSLFRKHQVTDSMYYKSYQYYLEHIDEMESIYEAVVDSLSLRERMLNNN